MKLKIVSSVKRLLFCTVNIKSKRESNFDEYYTEDY